jgi:glycine cleavage system H protein
LRQFATFGVVESVKAVSDLYAPISGEVVEVNDGLHDKPELLNTSPFGDGWIAKVKLSDPAELDALLDAAAYAELTSG